MTDQTTTEAHRLALSEALGLGTGAPWDAIRDRAAELAAIEPNVDTVASRAAQAISSMGADVRALTQERNRYRNAWHNARSRAVDARSDADLAEQQAATPLPVSEARTRLLQALDASYCQALGHTPEGLLAAYEASRTQTVDRDALRDRIDATLRTTRRIGHGTHRYDARCALCAGDVDALTEALAAAVLPATTNHDTDTSVTHRCADCGSGFVPGSDVELTHNCDDHRDAEPAPVDRAAVLREAAQRLYTALFPAVYADLGQKAAEGVNRAVSELRRVADETAATETQAHVCKPGASTYYCPTSGETESDCHGGFDACCDRQDLHQPVAGARQDGAQPGGAE